MNSIVIPLIRYHRTNTSWTVTVKACPKCNVPVIFGGGSIIENTFAFSDAWDRKYPEFCHHSYQFFSTSDELYTDGYVCSILFNSILLFSSFDTLEESLYMCVFTTNCLEWVWKIFMAECFKYLLEITWRPIIFKLHLKWIH